MRFGRPVKVAEGLFQVRALGARVTVVVEDGEVLLVDAGAKGSLGPILSGLKDLNLSPEQIERVVLTHYHPDHAGGLSELVEGRSVKVAAHHSEAAIIEGQEPPPNPLQHKLLAAVAQPVISLMSGRAVPVDEPLNDLDAVPFGEEARAVHVPGHTVGSIALYLPAKRAVIVGDALQYRLGWALSPPARGVTQEPETALQSLSRLLELDFDVICFSHFPPMRRGGHGALRRLLKRQDLDTPRKSGNS